MLNLCKHAHDMNMIREPWSDAAVTIAFNRQMHSANCSFSFYALPRMPHTCVSVKMRRMRALPLHAGPRGLLFRQILPGAEPLLDLMQQIADERSRSVSQARPNPVGALG